MKNIRLQGHLKNIRKSIPSTAHKLMTQLLDTCSCVPWKGTYKYAEHSVTQGLKESDIFVLQIDALIKEHGSTWRLVQEDWSRE